MKGNFAQQASLGAIASIASFFLATAAYAAPTPPVDLDDWSVPFNPTPLTCNAANCVSQTIVQESIPGATMPPRVNRLARLTQQNTGTGPVPGEGVAAIAEVKNGGATVNTGNGSYLSLRTGENVFGSLDLTYQFGKTEIDRVLVNVANQSSQAFTVALFTLNESDLMNRKFDFQVAYTVVAGHVHEEKLFFPTQTPTTELLFIYNPLAATGASYSFAQGGDIPWEFPTFSGGVSDLHAELCCIESSVPEPDSWAMMLFGFLAIGVVARNARTSVSVAV